MALTALLRRAENARQMNSQKRMVSYRKTPNNQSQSESQQRKLARIHNLSQLQQAPYGDQLGRQGIKGRVLGLYLLSILRFFPQTNVCTIDSWPRELKVYFYPSLRVFPIEDTSYNHPSNLTCSRTDLIQLRIPQQPADRSLVDIPSATHELDRV